MNEPLITWISVFIYTLFGLIVAVMAKRKFGRGMNDFFLGNRQMGGFVSVLTYAATKYSAFMMVGLAGLTYRFGACFSV